MSWTAACCALLLLLGAIAMPATAMAEQAQGPSVAQGGNHAAIDPDRDGLAAWQIVGAIVYVAVLAAAAFFVVYKVRGRNPLAGIRGQMGRINVIEARRASSGLTLVVVEVDGQRCLVAVSGSGVAIQGLSGAPNEQT